MYPPGREALLQDPTVTEALQQVAAEGWEQEARQHAQAALAALADQSDRQRDVHQQDQHHKHVMLSYQWVSNQQSALACCSRTFLTLAVCLCLKDAQETVKHIVNELQVRGYRTWFGASHLPHLHRPDDHLLITFDPCDVRVKRSG